MTMREALLVTCELIGDQKSDAAIRHFEHELATLPLADVLDALSRCRREVRGRLTLADILDRLPHGHPGPEEAWARVSQAMADDTRSLIWSDEMREAYAAAHALADDPVAARMAFKEVYTKAVSVSRAARATITWTLSRGTDKAHLESVILAGLKAGQLTAGYARALLPVEGVSTPEALALLEQHAPRLVAVPAPTTEAV